MHLIRANLVCVCGFLIYIYFFLIFKEYTKLSYLAPTLQKPFIFSAFFIPDFFVIFYIFLSNTLLKCLFWTFCFLKILKKHNSFAPHYTTNILQSCCWQFISHHRRGKLYFTRFSFQNSNSIPLFVMGNFFFFLFIF